METGMLWFDDSNRPLTEKVQTAVEYYQDKYEQSPNLCAVHPSMLPEGDTKVGPIELRGATAVMPHHFWLGVDQKAQSQSNGRRKAA
jgi:hypothetical protein